MALASEDGDPAARSSRPRRALRRCCARYVCSATVESRSARSPGRAWARRVDPVAARRGRRPHGLLLVTADQEDELRAFCNLVSRRAPDGNELAWALRRFELGCERGDPIEALSDNLLALRAMLEPEGPASGHARRTPRGAVRDVGAAPRARRARRPGDRPRAGGDRAARPPSSRARGCSRRRSRITCARCCATSSAATSTPISSGSPTSCCLPTACGARAGTLRPFAGRAPVSAEDAVRPRQSPSCSATRLRPRRSWTSSSRCPTSTGGRPSDRARRASRTVSLSRRTSTSTSARLAATRSASSSPSSGAQLLGELRRSELAAEPVEVHAVDDQLGQRQTGLVQPR